MLSVAKETHTVNTGPDPECSLPNPTQPCRTEIWWLHVAMQAVHPGAPTTGQKKNPCSSEASEAHPQPITLGTLNTLLEAATLEGGQRYHGGDCAVVMAAVGGGKASSLCEEEGQGGKPQ